METLSFPRYNVAEIVTHVRNKILTGADGKNLSKSDLHPIPKVGAEFAGVPAGLPGLWRVETGGRPGSPAAGPVQTLPLGAQPVDAES